LGKIIKTIQILNSMLLKFEDVDIEQQNPYKKPIINTRIRNQERIDSNKTKHSIRFEFELSAGIENPVCKGKADQVSSKHSVAAIKVMKPSLKQTQRKRNKDKKLTFSNLFICLVLDLLGL
jgi:hypothetical protein